MVSRIRHVVVMILWLAALAAAAAQPPAASPAAPAAAGDEYWDDRYGAIFHALGSWNTAATAVFRDELYVANVGIRGRGHDSEIVIWDGRSWRVFADDQGVLNGSLDPINQLAVYNNELYAGGRFTGIGGAAANNIARWDGTQWHALGGGIDGNQVTAMAAGPDGLYVAGEFTAAGGVAASNIARWDGAQWHALGGGLSAVPGAPRAFVFDLASGPGGMYVGGYFVTTDNPAVRNLARWTGSAWVDVGGSPNNGVFALAVDGATLYVGGGFTMTGELAIDRLAAWNGRQWSDLGGVGGAVSDLLIDNHRLYVGGNFATVGDGVAADRLAVWDLNGWQAIPNTLSGQFALSMFRGDLLQIVLNNTALIQRWDGANWYPLYSKFVMQWARAVAANDHVIYVAVDRMFVGPPSGGQPNLQQLVQFDGAVWSQVPLPDASIPLDPQINALHLDGDELYVASGSDANRIIKRTAGGWSALPGVFDSQIRSLAVINGTLYAGGDFRHIDGLAIAGLARWNGSGWSAVGALSGDVKDLAWQGANLSVVGSFTLGGSDYFMAARWDGAQWQGLAPTPASGYAQTVAAAADGSVYVGGSFTAIGGVSAANIARWTAAGGWTAIGGANHLVIDLAVGSDGLYALGQFTAIGGVPVRQIARWDGDTWHALGSGLWGGPPTPMPLQLAAQGRNVYVLASTLYVAGLRMSQSLAVWHSPTGPNLAPVAHDDALSLSFARPATIDVLANDGDFDNDPLALSVLAQPAHGAAAAVDGRIVYRPTIGYAGSDSFTYTIDDGRGGSATATVSLTIGATQSLVLVPVLQR